MCSPEHGFTSPAVLEQVSGLFSARHVETAVEVQRCGGAAGSMTEDRPLARLVPVLELFSPARTEAPHVAHKSTRGVRFMKEETCY